MKKSKKKPGMIRYTDNGEKREGQKVRNKKQVKQISVQT